jgi:hypothetical protein
VVGSRSGAAGTAIAYYLKSAPAGDVLVTISNTATGNAVRTCVGTKNRGMNRFQWALTGDPAAGGGGPAAVAVAVDAAVAAVRRADPTLRSSRRSDALRGGGGGGGGAGGGGGVAALAVVAAAESAPASTRSRSASRQGSGQPDVHAARRHLAEPESNARLN